jgi:hypothetical protein
MALLPILNNSHLMPATYASVNWMKLDEIFLPLTNTCENIISKNTQMPRWIAKLAAGNCGNNAKPNMG